MFPPVIFEGHDRCGKSTIAEALAKRLGTEVFMTNSKECFLERGALSGSSDNLARFNYMLACYVRDIHKSLSKPIVIYRSFMSERVYAWLLNRGTNEFLNRMTDNVFAGMGAVIILCENTKQQTFNDDFQSDEMVIKSAKLYNKFKYSTKCDIMLLDTSEQTVELYVDRIIEYLKLKAEENSK